VVLGCGSGAERATTPATPPARHADAGIHQAHVVSETDARTDASTNPRTDGGVIGSRESCSNDRPDLGSPTCSPSRPTAIESRIIAVRVVDATLEITVDRGSDHGVEKGWIGQVLDDRGKAISGARTVVERVEATRSHLPITMTDLHLSAPSRVALSPPP